jgi:hypothetical protein
MSFANFLRTVGHGVKVAGKAMEKPAIISGEIGLQVVPFIVPAAAPLAKAAETALSGASGAMSLPVSKGMSSVFQTSIGGSDMNPLESFAITMVFGILQTTIKNPAHKALLETQLVGIADMIYSTYGMTSPVAPPVTKV